MSPSTLSPLEMTAVALLIATAVLALIATNARKPVVARSALWLSIATVVGSIYALFGTFGDAKALPSATADGKTRLSLPKLVTFAARGQGAAKKRGDIVQDCENCPPVVVVPSGWFTLGASANDQHARPQELPARTVRLTRDFAIGQTEVTVRQFEAFLVASGHPVPSCWAVNGGGANAAATCVSWQDAIAYTRWLKKETGRTYRLPTASEWEYAARAGSGQPFPAANNSVASVQQVSLGGTGTARTRADGVSGTREGNMAVAQGTPNYFGLYDVNGGAAELTQDCATPSLESVSSEGVAADLGANCDRVVKDGMWYEDSRHARFSARRSISPVKAIAGVGFRVVRELDHGRN
jgi:formylglycine-generating enzyme required for sulfatase activity